MHFPALTRRRLIGLLATVICAAALIPVTVLTATASPAAPATTVRASATATSPTIIVNSATLVAHGAAVRLAFTATCGAGDDGSVNSTTTQAVGDRVAQGTTQTGFTCTGKPQHVSALAAANVNGAPFRPGIAVVMANVGDCPGANCTGASTDKVLRITR